MKVTTNIKLQPSVEQHSILLQTLEWANSACNYISEIAWNTRTFNQFKLHKIAYRDAKEKFGLTSQMVIRCIAKVADSYKKDKRTKRVFKSRGSIAYDNRILSFKGPDAVSVWTLNGRELIPFVCGEYQRMMLQNRKGEADLIYRNGAFYLYLTCDIPEPIQQEVSDFIGVDLGIVNIAVDSDEHFHSGAEIDTKRRIYAHRRRNLQRKGTKAAKRKLHKLSGRQARFQKDTNHVISKDIVRNAQRTERGIALEDLKGIRERVTARRSQRERLSNWSFFQLRSFIQYKARLAGVPVVLVDPRNTSKTCPSCGCIDRANRPSQSSFSCRSCGYSGPADLIAAWNIRARAVVNQPKVAA